MKLLAIDGNSIMNRAFYGIKMLSNKKGVFTNALTGFMNIYLKVTADIKPDAVACAFDMRAPTFRHKADSEYKANRHGMPDELAQQMPLIKELLTDLGIRILETEGFEADDILGTLAKGCSDKGDQCYILTGDRDSLQLVNDNVTVLLHGTKELKIYTPSKFREDYGLEPLQLIDLKGLMGDSSDNIKGVKGIGEKTALTLIKEHHSIEQLYNDMDSGELTATKSVLAKLEAGREDAAHSKWLATIVYNAPVDTDAADYIIKDTDEKAVSALLTNLEMYKLLERLNIKPSAEIPLSSEETPKQEKINYTASEGNIPDNIAGDIVSFIYTDGIIKAAYNNTIYTISDKDAQLKFLSSDCEKYSFCAKAAYRLCFDNGRELKNLTADADILGYLLNT